MFRPCIDIHSGKVKQIVGGTLNDSGNNIIENFVSEKSPAYYAELFKKDNLKGGHVIMLGSGNEKVAVQALNAYPQGLQIGGGITPDNALFYLEQGASHVIVTSYVFKNGIINFENLNKLIDITTKNKLVIDLSCRKKDDKYYVVTDRWQNFTNFEINKENLLLLSQYCDEFLIHGVDVEGKQQGIDKELVKKIALWSPIKATYAGGIRSFEDIDLINKYSNQMIDYTVGSALDIFGGKMSYDKVVANSKEGQYPSL